MRGKGINYDTGFSPGGVSSREQFDAGIVRREMRVIADDLRCTAVRISGADPARLSVAGELAAAAGLEVWFAPFPCELGAADLAPLFAECADRAEHLRRSGAAVVLVCGCELSLFGAGFLPGSTVYARIARLQAGGFQRGILAKAHDSRAVRERPALGPRAQRSIAVNAQRAFRRDCGRPEFRLVDHACSRPLTVVTSTWFLPSSPVLVGLPQCYGHGGPSYGEGDDGQSSENKHRHWALPVRSRLAR